MIIYNMQFKRLGSFSFLTKFMGRLITCSRNPYSFKNVQKKRHFLVNPFIIKEGSAIQWRRRLESCNSLDSILGIGKQRDFLPVSLLCSSWELWMQGKYTANGTATPCTLYYLFADARFREGFRFTAIVPHHQCHYCPAWSNVHCMRAISESCPWKFKYIYIYIFKRTEKVQDVLSSLERDNCTINVACQGSPSCIS